MGRHFKEIQSDIGIERRETGYYSTPSFMAEFIAETLINLNPQGRLALDPCVGRGEMAGPLMKRGITVTGMDILPFNLPSGIAFKQIDFLEYYREQKNQCILGNQIHLPYDFYVANPPYNCHEVSYIRQNKSSLLSIFDEIGVYNMYSLFILAMIDCAQPGAIISFITLDSFLTAKSYLKLRQKILHQCAVHYLILCPNDLFSDQGADVRTCLMILQKGKNYQKQVKLSNRPLNRWELMRVLKSKDFLTMPIEKITLSSALDYDEFIE